MDLSKLPRLSDTQKAAQQPQGDAPHASPSPGPQPGESPLQAPGSFCPQCGGALRPGARFCESCGAAMAGPASPPAYPAPSGGLGAEIWLSLVLGIIFVFLGWRFAEYAWSEIRGVEFDTGTTWASGDRARTPVNYWELSGKVAWTESGIFLFGLALIFEAVAMIAASTQLRARRALIGLALFVTLLATAYNLYVAGLFFSAGQVAILSLLAVAFGGYIALYQWQQLRILSAADRLA
jgi:hypothetical protein